MRKLLTLTLAVLMVGLFAAVVFAAVEAGDDGIASQGTVESTTDTTGTTNTTETTDTTDTTDTTTAPDDGAVRRDDVPFDISGPCDEAEHANDPRCTGAGVGTTPDRVDDDDHHRGRNRGPGGGHSGSGSGHDFDDDFDDDDFDDDDYDDHGGNSGSGGGNSGHGGGDDD